MHGQDESIDDPAIMHRQDDAEAPEPIGWSARLPRDEEEADAKENRDAARHGNCGVAAPAEELPASHSLRWARALPPMPAPQCRIWRRNGSVSSKTGARVVWTVPEEFASWAVDK